MGLSPKCLSKQRIQSDGWMGIQVGYTVSCWEYWKWKAKGIGVLGEYIKVLWKVLLWLVIIWSLLNPENGVTIRSLLLSLLNLIQWVGKPLVPSFTKRFTTEQLETEDQIKMPNCSMKLTMMSILLGTLALHSLLLLLSNFLPEPKMFPFYWYDAVLYKLHKQNGKRGVYQVSCRKCKLIFHQLLEVPSLQYE